MKTTRVLVVALVVAGGLTGCGAADLPVVEPEGTHAAPEPTATQARETGLVPPARPFAGDCANLMSDAEASTVLGKDAVSYVPELSFAPEYTVELHAGMHCKWVSADGTFSDSADVVVLPADAVAYDEPSGCTPAGDAFLAPRCAVEAVVNGTRVSGAVWVTADSSERPSQQRHGSFSCSASERPPQCRRPPSFRRSEHGRCRWIAKAS